MKYDSIDQVPEDIKKGIEEGKYVAVPASESRFNGTYLAIALAGAAAGAVLPLFGPISALGYSAGYIGAGIAIYLFYLSARLNAKLLTMAAVDRAMLDHVQKGIMEAIEKAENNQGTFGEDIGLTNNTDEETKIH
jgi:hypothetical protein